MADSEMLKQEARMDVVDAALLTFESPRKVVRSRYFAFIEKARKLALDYVQVVKKAVPISASVHAVLDRFIFSMGHALKVATKGAALVIASPSDPLSAEFDSDDDDDDEEEEESYFMDFENADLDVEKFFDDLIGEDRQAAHDKGRRLVAELDALMQAALDEELETCIDLLDAAMHDDERKVLMGKWAEKERAAAASIRANSMGVDGGRFASDPIISYAQWETGVLAARGAIELEIGQHLGPIALAAYKEAPFHARTDRYYIETRVKGPVQEPRSASQLGCRLRKEVCQAFERFTRRMDVITRVNAAAEEMMQRDAIIGQKVSQHEWEELILAGRRKGARMAMDRMAAEGAFITPQMKSTLNGMLHAIVRTPAQLPTLNADDFQRLIDMVLSMAATEVCDEIALVLRPAV